MRFKKQQDVILRKTDGRCHICWKRLARKNYGVVDACGAWEVDHSVPQASGGTDNLNNLLPACISCNRSKQDSSTKAARKKHGYRASPLSERERNRNALLDSLGGAVAGRFFLGSFGPLGIVIGAAAGTLITKNHEPK